MAPYSHLFFYKGIRNSNNVLSSIRAKTRLEKKINGNSLTIQVIFFYFSINHENTFDTTLVGSSNMPVNVNVFVR